MTKDKLIYEGKAKKMWSVKEDDDLLIAEFKDSLTAFNGVKKAEENGKGALNNKISTEIFKLLEKHGIKTDLVKKIDDINQVVRKCKIIPLEVVVRNIATGSLTKRLGIKDGTILPFTLVEFCYKNDELNDPILNDDHCLLLDAVKTKDELEVLKAEAKKINKILKDFFDKKDLKLVDFKVEFGKTKDGEIILADEISPDSCRFWDKNTNEKLDKDRFRQDLGGVKVAYEEVLRRILG